MRNLTLALVVVIGVLGGFYGGWKYSQSKVGAPTPAAAVASLPAAAATASAGTTGGGGGAGGGGFAGRGATAGQVTAVNGSVVTVHNPTTGQDVKVDISSGTVINKTTTGSLADLRPGVNVTVTGQAGADGTVSATAVNIVTTLPAGGGGGGGRGQPSASPST
jgi:hypothetical protein